MTEIKRLREWLTQMVETGEADDMDCKAWMAEAALCGWSLQDWGADKIPTGTNGAIPKKEDKRLPNTRDRVVTFMLSEAAVFFGGSLMQVLVSNPRETAQIRELMEKLYDGLVNKGLIEPVIMENGSGPT